MSSKGKIILAILTAVFAFSCGGETLPKPKAMLRLKYPEPTYDTLVNPCPYIFEKNKLADIQEARINKKCWFNLYYAAQKATLYISYYPVSNNLDSLLKDAQNITQEHVVKADEIIQEPYADGKKRVFGMLYKVSGDAASQSQFYITDSINHFISGSVYFKAKPNYDSILPAANYLHNDVKHIIETLHWKN